MSLKSWKREFYRTSANKVSKAYALRHSLKKWMGLKPSNRKKHKVSLCDGKLMNDSDIIDDDCLYTSDIDFLEIDEKTCALCNHFLHHDCKDCLLVKAGIASCVDCDSPFDLFVSKGQVSPMIKALQKALNRKEKK